MDCSRACCVTTVSHRETVSSGAARDQQPVSIRVRLFCDGENMVIGIRRLGRALLTARVLGDVPFDADERLGLGLRRTPASHA